VPRTPSFLLFLLTLALALALVAWWTVFQVHASNDLERVGERLVAGDVAGAAAALGAADPGELVAVAQARRVMFVSEGAAFAAILLLSGLLFARSLRREFEVRTSQDRFLAGATHELKTPLATIVLLLESLRDARLPSEKSAHYLAMGLLEAERLERGLTNVLTAAGLRTAAKHWRQVQGDLAEDVRAAVAAMQPRALAAGVALRADAPASLPSLRDPEALQLVLRNLLDNAIKYSAAGGTVSVALAARGPEADIRVRDEGRGMDADELAHAFVPFWRGSDNATGGTGLGLHLVHELVQAHGGSVAAASPGRGRGAEFTVRLPLRGGVP
jgi:signal transduction histidine kinase